MVKHRESRGFKGPEMTTEIKQLVIPTPLPHSHGILGLGGAEELLSAQRRTRVCLCDGGGLGLLHEVNNQGCLLNWRLQHPLKKWGAHLELSQ